MKRISYKFILLVGLLVGLSICLQAQDDFTPTNYGASDTIPENYGLFEKDEVLDISLRFDLRTYTRKKPKEYMKAILTYHFSDTDSVNHHIQLKSRGQFRNEFCSFPPIKLNFKKTEFKYQDLNDISTMKLVTHCQYTAQSEQYIFKEYLAYKLYNVLDKLSFRVRLLRIHYIDTGKKGKSQTAYGFLIEPRKILAKRNNLIATNSLTISQTQIQPDNLDQVGVFQYMIGNGDWAVVKQHNVKVFVYNQLGTSKKGLAVPYDFDYSGLVNTSYAVPSEGSEITHVTQRIYTGMCRDKGTFQNTLNTFQKKKDKLYQVIEDFELLTPRTRKEMINYLDGFFVGLDNEQVVKHILSTCRNY
jgi:hypothetical protein